MTGILQFQTVSYSRRLPSTDASRQKTSVRENRQPCQRSPSSTGNHQLPQPSALLRQVCASSNQSVVRDGTEYENVYPSGHKDQDSPGEDRSPSASSSSSTSEDVEKIEIEGPDGNQALESVVGADGLRQFIMLPEWTVHRFTSVIRERHFSTFRTNFQIPDYIPIRLPYVSERCYYDGVEGVGVYEQVLKAGLRFPLSTLHRELLHYLGLSVTQISPNAWRVFIAMEILYGAMSNGERRLTVREFLHCYRPDEIDRSRGLYRFASRSPLLKVIFETPDSNRDWKSRYFFLEGDRWMNRPGETEYMPVDTTWGIINQARRGRPQVSLEEFSFLEKVCRKAKPDERTWAKSLYQFIFHGIL
uniref:Uncharacterized protein n=1 Tax=Quercus lobata TaxID=97700 RepID=A0A7N2MSX9_QUELO